MDDDYGQMSYGHHGGGGGGVDRDLLVHGRGLANHHLAVQPLLPSHEGVGFRSAGGSGGGVGLSEGTESDIDRFRRSSGGGREVSGDSDTVGGGVSLGSDDDDDLNAYLDPDPVEAVRRFEAQQARQAGGGGAPKAD